MRVIFYSTHCPKCNVLKKKLDQKNVAYEEVNDVEIMTQKGFMQAPMLEVDDKVMNFSEATNWINTL
jgi:glutaredoxin-related protein